MRRLVVVLLALLLSACVGIPSSGPVSPVAADDGLGESTVRYVPARPAKGASPQQIVRGYLDAMLAYPVSTGTATAFLTPEAAASWKASAGLGVYRDPQVSTTGRSRLDDGESATVSLRAQQDARLDGRGRRVAGVRRTEQEFRVVQVDGEWRISNPQDGMLVTAKFFADYFRPFELFYLDPTGARLVPEPVHLAVGGQLATALVTSLARGPGDDLAEATRTDVPGRRELRSSVTVGGEGVADVVFTTDLGRLTMAEQERLSAQVVWTLRQVREVTGVRITGDDIILAPDDTPVQDVTAWGSYGPSLSAGAPYALVGDRLVSLDGSDVEPVSGPWGEDARGAVDAAVGSKGIAMVLPGRTTLVVTGRDGSSPREVSGEGLVRPAWDDQGRVWIVDGDGAGTRVRLLAGDELVEIDDTEVSGLDVRSFVLSPDAGRYALLTAGDDGGTALYAGTVVRDESGEVQRLGPPSRVAPESRSPDSPVWASGTGLAFMAADEAGVQVYTATIDGSPAEGPPAAGHEPLPDMSAQAYVVGNGTDPPRYVVDDDQRLWYSPPGGTWRKLDVEGVRALASAR